MNALEELHYDFVINRISISDILWARIKYAPYYENKDIEVMLPVNHTRKEIKSAIKCLRKINYDSGYGSQELFGTIVLKNGSWLERYEYDGSECWSYKSTPKWENAY